MPAGAKGTMPSGAALNSNMSEKIKMREAEAKLLLVPSTKEFDVYQPLHEQSKQDLERSMDGLKESMDAEKIRVQECPDQHLFGEESMEKDRLRGVENMAKLKGIVDLQDEVYRSIMVKVKATEEAPDWRKNEKTRADCRKITDADPYQMEQGDTVRVQNACAIANHRVRRQARQDIHQQHRLRMAADDAKYYDSLREKHKLVEEQAARSQKARVEKQMQKTFVAQQKRNEQQKMLKEIQRSQDHQFELLQLKHHPEAVSTIKLPALSRSASKPQIPAGEPVTLNRHMSEPIYRDITNSHNLYSTTLERWRTFEADNERRTDAYWRKMVHGENRRTATKPESKMHVFRSAAKAMKTMNTIRKFMKRGKSVTLPDAGEDTGYDDEEYMLEAVDTSHMSETSFEMTSGSASPSHAGQGELRSKYSRRLSVVQDFHEDLERQNIEKAERDRLRLEEKQRLGRAYQQSKADKAGEYCSAWEKKSEASSVRRQTLAVQNQGECDVKMTAAQQRLDEIDDNQHRERMAMGDNKSQLQMANKASADKQMDDTVTGFKATQEQKQERGAELLEGRLKQAYKRANSGCTDVARQMHALKEQNEREFRKKTADGIKAKQERQAEVMKRVRKSVAEPAQRDQTQAMERLRLVRKDKGRDVPNRAPPAELRLPPELALSPRLSLSPKRLTGGSSPATWTDAGQGSPGRAADSSPNGLDVLEQDTMKVISRRSKDLSYSTRKPTTPTSFLSASGGSAFSDANLGASAGSGSSNDSDDEASDGEAQFLEDLRSKSGKWLQQMRKATENH